MTTSPLTNAVRIAIWCDSNLSLGTAKLSDEYYYDSLPFCLIDAIFSIGVKYASTKRTVESYTKKYSLTRLDPISHVQSDCHEIDDLIHNIGGLTDYGATGVFCNRQRTSPRGGILKSEAVYLAAKTLQKHNIQTLSDFRGMTSIALDNLEKDFIKIPGQTSGISFSYLCMLAGDDNSIKPDRWILRACELATGIAYSPSVADRDLHDACKILERTYTNLTPRLLDHTIWIYMR